LGIFISLKKLPNVQEKMCFLWLDCDEIGWVFSVSIFNCDEEMKKKTGYRKKIDRQKKYLK